MNFRSLWTSFPEDWPLRSPTMRQRSWVQRSSVSALFYPHLSYVLTMPLVFSLVSCVAMVHAVRQAMQSLKKTGTDFGTSGGMNPKEFFEVMGTYPFTPDTFNNAHVVIFERFARGHWPRFPSWRAGIPNSLRRPTINLIYMQLRGTWGYDMARM